MCVIPKNDKSKTIASRSYEKFFIYTRGVHKVLQLDYEKNACNSTPAVTQKRH